MYYGYRCYNSEDKPIGWLYTHNSDTEIVWTDTKLNWCKKWKTQKGAVNSFDHFNSRWKFKSEGGYLKIEVMPEFEEPESAASRKQKLLEEWGDDNIPEATTTFKFELIKGLPEEHGTYLFLLENGSIKQGYFSSFPYPNHEEVIRITNCEDEYFYYEKCVGWLKKVE
ncbi:hypothetical protein [Rivularia sp. UHCC 0363]|uniref:hypothetical protein n=1 Tax=Rivularia sp. UHCC 0363 TaxID=3110244 RepID=UPI002B200810|nr:hypothetical protein [Rivularia sp. UHCC 0363]MEA5595762.1 hypothetical protein [Rivularia sp. UHCC 0363]